MSLRKKDGNLKNIDTLIGASTTFNGNIESEGIIRIDGKINGEVKTSGGVYIGKNAKITGNIYSSNVYISGTVIGNVFSSGIVRIFSTAKLIGDIEVKSFISDEGAIFQGKCKMLDDESPDNGNKPEEMK
ncbi:MAG TPA: polymer-forming cytoskeletal protein [Clostridiaceae bacterium]|nr:polymer-forming cytoskeletal protein [Clostridiaceae bacterium]